MRLRYIPKAADALADQPDLVIQKPEEYKGKFQNRFKTSQPIHLEIGMGKGKFLIDMAKAFPHYNFIGIELQTSVLYRALEALEGEHLVNIQLMNMNAEFLMDVFEEGEVDHIYLNFSDPWPKNRHEKRRLTHPRFLSIYGYLLKKGGVLEFKTDNRKFFDFSLQAFNECHLTLRDVSLDLHADEDRLNIMTEYEEKFTSQGQVIYYAKVDFDKVTPSKK